MPNKNIISPLTLLLFATVDILLYDTGTPILQLLFSVLSYGFILLNSVKNINTGVLYFISFNVITIGYGNYQGVEDTQYGYWGMRIGPFSANILFTLLLVLMVGIKKNFKSLIPNDIFSRFFLFFFVWGLVVGTLMTVWGVNYTDNYLSDIMIFLPAVFYIVLCKDLSLNDLRTVIQYLIPITMYSLFLAYVLDKKCRYSAEEFLIGNSFINLAPFAVIVLYRYMNRKAQIAYIALLIFLFMTLSILIAGKIIIGFILLIVWWMCRNKKWRYFNLTVIFAVIPLLVILLKTLIDVVGSNSGIISFKLGQVASLFSNEGFLVLAAERSSVGNIIAETITLCKFLITHPIFLIFGKGFGGGIPDLFGFLFQFAGAAGYAYVDGVRNNYFNLHIAPLKVLIDGGIIIFAYYVKVLYRILKLKTGMSFLAFLMMVFFFYVSKELMLLTYILLRICYLEKLDSQLISARNEQHIPAAK